MNIDVEKAMALSEALMYAEDEPTRIGLAINIVRDCPEIAVTLLAGLASFAADAETNVWKLKRTCEGGRR
jgi:hypothetical protein